MQLLRADADLGAKAKLEPIAESAGRIDIHNSSIYHLLELTGMVITIGHNYFRMSGAVTANVQNGFLNAVHYLYRKNQTMELC